MTTTPKQGEVEDLAKRIWNTMEKDCGYQIATFMGQDASKMSDEQLIQWSKIKFKEPTTCHECGQDLH